MNGWFFIYVISETLSCAQADLRARPLASRARNVSPNQRTVLNTRALQSAANLKHSHYVTMAIMRALIYRRKIHLNHRRGAARTLLGGKFGTPITTKVENVDSDIPTSSDSECSDWLGNLSWQPMEIEKWNNP
jgi:hypothetical protein